MNIPEDSVLKRHYMTELKYREDALIELTRPKQFSPLWSIEVMVPLIGFIFMMAVVFI